LGKAQTETFGPGKCTEGVYTYVSLMKTVLKYGNAARHAKVLN
jgi:hypothetical protein